MFWTLAFRQEAKVPLLIIMNIMMNYLRIGRDYHFYCEGKPITLPVVESCFIPAQYCARVLII